MTLADEYPSLGGHQLLEAAGEEARTDQQDERHRRLRDNEQVAAAVAARVIGRAASALAQRREDVAARCSGARERGRRSAPRSPPPRARRARRPARGGPRRRAESSAARCGPAPARNGRDRDPERGADAASTNASTISLRTRPPRLPPSAWRTASSRCRASPRTRQRLATLPQATSSTISTVPSRIHNGSRAPPTISSFIGRTVGR